MSKGDLMKLVLTKEERGYCDSAIPKSLWSSCNTSLCVFDCRNNKLVNLAEKLITSGKLQEILDDKQHAEYLLKKSKKSTDIESLNF